MTTQEFLADLANEPFSDATKAEVASIIGTETVLTPDLLIKITECLEADVDEDLKDVEIDQAEADQLQKELDETLKAIEAEAVAAEAEMEKDVRELDELAQKVDVLERLHT